MIQIQWLSEPLKYKTVVRIQFTIISRTHIFQTKFSTMKTMVSGLAIPPTTLQWIGVSCFNSPCTAASSNMKPACIFQDRTLHDISCTQGNDKGQALLHQAYTIFAASWGRRISVARQKHTAASACDLGSQTMASVCINISYIVAHLCFTQGHTQWPVSACHRVTHHDQLCV